MFTAAGAALSEPALGFDTPQPLADWAGAIARQGVNHATAGGLGAGKLKGRCRIDQMFESGDHGLH